MLESNRYPIFYKLKNNYYLKLLNKYFGELIAIIFSLFLFGNILFKEKINNQTKFVNITSNISFYEFKDGARGYHHYYFKCKEYCNIFQIKADYLPFFEKDKFPIKNESNINFVITEKDFKNINNCDKIFVLGITTNKQKILDFSKVLEFENNNYFFLFPIILFFGAIILILIRNKK